MRFVMRLRIWGVAPALPCPRAYTALLGAADFYDGNRSADRIIPELQDLKVGDTIKISKQAPFDVVALEPNRIAHSAFACSSLLSSL
jgi:hypothetical protein